MQVGILVGRVRNLLFCLLFRFDGGILKENKSSYRNLFLLFFKGLGMGAADIIPGVSGGTIAFITGIYEDLIEAIHSINFLFVVYFFKGFFDKAYFRKSYEIFRNIHFRFLIPLVLGIVVAFLFLANIIGPLREMYPTYSAAFFLGLVLASVVYVYRSISEHVSFKIVLMVIIGVIVGIGVVSLSAVQTSHSYIVILFSGVITVCAMILPGVSGAFILWFLGQYDFMLGVLRKAIALDFSQAFFIVVYVIGGIFGLLVFARLLSFLLHRFRVMTLAFLLGLMLGALWRPVDIIYHFPSNFGITVLTGLVGMGIVGMFCLFSGYLKKDVQR
jgi:putative membrane protein